MKRKILILLLSVNGFWAWAQVTEIDPVVRGEAQPEFPQAYGHLALVTESGMSCNRAMRLSSGANFSPLVPFDPNNPETFLPQPAHEALNEGFSSFLALEYNKAQHQIFAGLRFYIKRPETIEDYQAMRVKFFSQPLTDIFKTSLLPKIQYQNLTDLLGLWALVLVEEGSHSLAAQLLTQIIALKEAQVGIKNTDIWLLNNFSVAAARLGGYAQSRELFDKARGTALTNQRIENPIEMAIYFNNMAMLAPEENLEESIELQNRALSLAARAGAPTPLIVDMRTNLNNLLRKRGIFLPPDALAMNIAPDFAQNKDFVAYYQFIMAKQAITSGTKEGIGQIVGESKNFFKQANRPDVLAEILKTETEFWASQNEKGKMLNTLNEMRTLLNTQFSATHPMLLEVQSQIALNSPISGALSEYSTYFSLLEQYLDRHFLFLTLQEQWIFLQKRHREISLILSQIEKNTAAYNKITPALFLAIAKIEGIHTNVLNSLRYNLLNSNDVKTKEAFFDWLDAGEQFTAAMALPKTAYPELNAELQSVLLKQKMERVQSLPGKLNPVKNMRLVNAEFIKKQLQNGEAVLMAYRYAKGQDSAYCVFFQTQEGAAPQLFFVKNLDKDSQLDAGKMYGSFAPKLANRARIFFLASGAYLKNNPYTFKDLGTKYGFWMVSGIDKIGNQTTFNKGSRAVYFHQSAPNPQTDKLASLIRAQYPVTLAFGPTEQREQDFKSFADSSAVVVLEGQVILGEKFEHFLLNSGVVLSENALPLPLGAGLADGIINPYEILSQNLSCKVFIFNLENIPARYETQNLMDLARAATQAGAEYSLINTQNTPIEVRQAFIGAFLAALQNKQAHLAFLEADKIAKGSGFILIK